MRGNRLQHQYSVCKTGHKQWGKYWAKEPSPFFKTDERDFITAFELSSISIPVLEFGSPEVTGIHMYSG